MIRLFNRNRFKALQPAVKNVLVAELVPCCNGEQVVQQGAADLLSALRQLVSSPEAIYQKLYGGTLLRFAEFCQNMPLAENAAPYSLLRQRLTLAIAVLKMRRGELLPPHAGAETIAVQEPLWTFALFAASLLHNLHTLQNDRVLKSYNAQGEYIHPWALSAGTLYEPKAYFSLHWQAATPVLAKAAFTSVLASRCLMPAVISWLGPVLPLWWEALLGENPLNPITAILVKTQRALSQLTSKAASQPTATAPDVTAPLHRLTDLLQFIKNCSANHPTAKYPNWLRVNQGLWINQDCLQAFLQSHAPHALTVADFIQALQPLLVLENHQPLHTLRPRAFEDRRLVKGIVIAEHALPETWRQQPIDTVFKPAIEL